MFYHGGFKDIYNTEYDVQILSGNDLEEIPIVLGSDPCTITTSSESLFSPIKSRSCTITFLSTEYHMDLYNPKQRETRIMIKDVTHNKVVFRGFLTPAEYNQTYTYMDEISLECIDGVSSSKDYKWSNNGQFNTFIDILMGILIPCGYKGHLFVPRVYSRYNNTSVNTTTSGNDILKFLTVSSNNFIDDDEAQTPWTQYEVLTEILKYVGWSLVPDGDDVYLVDYYSIDQAAPIVYSKYDFQLYNDPDNPVKTPTYDTFNIHKHIGSSEGGIYESVRVDEASGGAPNFSIDDIYNKIEISDNLYEIKDITTDLFDDKYHISVNTESSLGADGSQWTKTETSGWLWWKKSTTSITGWDYQTFCRLDPSSGWTHYYYQQDEILHNVSLETYIADSLESYHDPSSTSLYTKHVNGVINTRCCLIQHYAHIKNEGGNKLPASLDWTDVMTFFVADDTTPNTNILNLSELEYPVLEYNISDNVQWKPSSGKSWITIQGDLYYQYDGAKYGEKNRDTLNIVNKDKLYYTTAPVDKSVTVDAQNYTALGRNKNEDNYRQGFKLWKFRLQIGTGSSARWWNGDEWVNSACDFYIKYNNDPKDGDIECVQAFEWMSPVNSHDYKDKVGVDGYCIPIDSSIANDPSSGPLRLIVYNPSIIPVEYLEKFRQIFPNSYSFVSGLDLSPCIFAKDFEIGYVYTDTDTWYNTHDSQDNSDKVYVGYIDDEYVNDFDSLEFKINTTIKDRPISRSYVCLSNGGYLNTLKHKFRTESKVQEYNVIDQYLDHYGDKRVIYEANIHYLPSPLDRFTVNTLDGNFMVDSSTIDLKQNNTRIKLIQY